eukprot:TRINITY_DN7356_c0_g1_i10.p1 TRINITY_DN7356_c0_g1~~TRINITY_DN7356_c0_g1_i10.p1  ORF type:complete len:437 (-),score=53.30 TRINITY_DN7356_c0_g1_i10:139-1449(-)
MSSTTDASFQSFQPVNVEVVNQDVIYPLVYSIDTPIMLTSGGVLNITGGFFTPQTNIIISNNYLRSSPVASVTYISPTKLSAIVNGTFKAETYLVVNVRSPEGALHSCPASPQSRSIGFLTCTGENQLYITSGCAPGTYGDGITCKPCPANSECPGGNRVWPTSGSWSPSEDVAPVSCYPPEACEGGRFSTCREGYVGEFCSTCAEGYYRQGPVCRSCADDDFNLQPILILTGTFAAIVSLSIVAMPSKRLYAYAVTLLSIQQIVQMGIAGSEFIPELRKIFMSLSWILFEFNFVRPGCDTAVIPFPDYYFMTLAIVAICGLSMIIFAAFRAVFVYFMSKKGPRPLAYYFEKFKLRAIDALTMLGYLAYILITARTMQLIDCKEVYGTELLRVEMARECYEGSHLGAAIVAWIVFTVYVIGYPLYSYYCLREARCS